MNFMRKNKNYLEAHFLAHFSQLRFLSCNERRLLCMNIAQLVIAIHASDLLVVGNQRMALFGKRALQSLVLGLEQTECRVRIATESSTANILSTTKTSAKKQQRWKVRK